MSFLNCSKMPCDFSMALQFFSFLFKSLSRVLGYMRFRLSICNS